MEVAEIGTTQRGKEHQKSVPAENFGLAVPPRHGFARNPELGV